MNTDSRTPMIYTRMHSPVGELVIAGVASDTAPGGVALSCLKMEQWKGEVRIESDWRYQPDAFAHVVAQLEAYFAGELKEFDLAFATHGTAFQERVWAVLREIPYGTTTTYGAITAELGLERVQARAVGGAVGTNPLGIVVPCHRVVGANGSLTGYAGGLENKEALLVLEGVLPQRLA
jgi:methylated-DNA-[protein]-cysteine S-methyltransferase